MNTILLLDDNPAVVQILSTILRINGQYHVFEAGNPHEAVIQLIQRPHVIGDPRSRLVGSGLL